MKNNKEAKESLNKLFLSPDIIIKRAKEYKEKSFFPENEKEIPYYYYIVKHFIAEHEARFGTILKQKICWKGLALKILKLEVLRK